MSSYASGQDEIGISYSVADAGIASYKKQRSLMEGYLQTAQHLMTHHDPKEWTDASEKACRQIITDAKNNLDKMDANIGALNGYVATAKAGHKANEARNANILANAYINATSV